MTEPCAVCGKPVDLAEQHITITRAVEVQRRRTVTVLDAAVLSYMHLTCDDKVRSGVAVTAGAVA